VKSLSVETIGRFIAPEVGRVRKGLIEKVLKVLPIFAVRMLNIDGARRRDATRRLNTVKRRKRRGMRVQRMSLGGGHGHFLNMAVRLRLKISAAALPTALWPCY